jgi:sugar lactone lactonase YvrE
MKKLSFLSMVLLAVLSPLACSKQFTLAPVPPSLPTSTPTASPTSSPIPVPMVTTLAGTAGTAGSANGQGTAASFDAPEGVAVDSSGNLYVADYFNELIREITPGGLVSTLAGTVGVAGSANGTGTGASFDGPSGVALDVFGNIYVADSLNNVIREIAPGGVVTTLAGQPGVAGAANGSLTTATFSNDFGIAVDGTGNIYVADRGNQLIREITSGVVVSTLAGQAGVAGAANGAGNTASFNGPDGIAVDSSGNVYVADYSNDLIRKITPGGVVSTLAGQAGVAGSTNGTGTAASFNGPSGVAVDSSGNVYVADHQNDLIRKITPGGVVSTYAGQAGVAGNTNGPLSSALFSLPSSLAVDSAGNLYVSEFGNQLIRKITP